MKDNLYFMKDNHDFYVQTQIVREKQQLYYFRNF